MTHLCESFVDTILHGHVECTKKLISNGSDPNFTDGVGRSPLHWAAYVDRENFLKILVDAGANIYGADICGKTPLHDAVTSQSLDCIKTLLDAGANPNIADNRGKTPLHDAAWCGHHACIQTFVDAGADPNITDALGNTPLHTAVLYEYEICLEKLIDIGANPDVADNDGETPLQLAIRNKNKECGKMLAVRILVDRALTNDEWDLIPPDSDIGNLLPIVMARDGRDAASKLVSRLPEGKRKVLQTAAICLSRFVHRDLVEIIVVKCM